MSSSLCRCSHAMTRLILAITFMASAMVATPTVLRADPITYHVYQQVGDALVTGSITTDGVMGAVTSIDIASWSFGITSPQGSAQGTGTGKVNF